MSSQRERCGFQILEWGTRWRCSKPAGHELDDPRGDHRLIPEWGDEQPKADRAGGLE